MTAPSTGRGFHRVLRRLDVTLFTVCAILVIDQLAASASIGASSIFWWVFTLVFFFVPYALISAELGATYPEEGGIYAWVRRAYGPRWGARTSWFYWINVALWMPSVYVLFAGIFAQMFAPDLSLWAQIAIGIVLTWVTVYINVISLAVGKWVPNGGAVIKAAIMVTIGVGGIVYATRHGVANDMSLRAMAPSWGAGLAFLPVIVYNFLGFELMSGASEEMKSPQRDVPIAIGIAGLLISTFYLLGTVGILIALPVDEIGLIEGLLDSLHKLFGEYSWGPAFVTVLGIGALATFIANMVTWTMGANRSASEAAERGDLPRVFGKLHPIHRTPASAAIITGVVSTVVIIIYGLFAATAEDLFWSLFAFSSIVFLMPYILMFAAFARLRVTEASHARPYRMPGGNMAAKLAATVCILFILQAIVLFVWVPGEPLDTSQAVLLVVGVIVTWIVGDVLISRAQRAAPPRGGATGS